jgi:hypothetical protein
MRARAAASSRVLPPNGNTITSEPCMEAGSPHCSTPRSAARSKPCCPEVAGLPRSICMFGFESAASASSAIPAILGISEELSQLTGCCGGLAMRVGLGWLGGAGRGCRGCRGAAAGRRPETCDPARLGHRLLLKHSTLGSLPGGGSSRRRGH